MAHALRKLSVQVLNNNVEVLGAVAARNSHFWGNVKMGPPDVILGISEAFKRDQDPNKVNLGVGAYRDDHGKPFVLPSVRKAEEILHSKHLNHEYAPISGEGAYTQAVAKLAFGEDNEIFKNKSYCTVQVTANLRALYTTSAIADTTSAIADTVMYRLTKKRREGDSRSTKFCCRVLLTGVEKTLSGTGALRLGLEFISKHYAQEKVVYMPSPTWGNHPQICNQLNLTHKQYRYFDANTNGFDLKGALEDINKMPEGSIIVLHACAHNPTGVDPKLEEWKQLSEVVQRRKLLPFFDMAYQGFATGSVDRDAAAVRLFVKNGHQVILAQSFAKNMGLYGERAGALSFLCGEEESANKMMSQLKIMIRTMYSNPPLYGARIVQEILTTPELKAQWLEDVKLMADRIITMRTQLRQGIEGAGSKLPWKHITDQIGMFCFTGLKPNQVERLTKEFHIYLTKDGRISMAGLFSKNVQYVADAMHKVSA